ncbi:Endonuclease/exonuclease/phosphatase [Ephemerocybe angulata]|uniref:Endonuclease/exonuclease/phosphatase n=1 Tax=Ephemerocybe angulata TaxID=980116 RepID=A0A8H6LYN7_9AGAR|nr:Endonuclease/exonuclease/phosphatase [Tulosesus angulatus]
MRSKGIGILAVQETHLSSKALDDLNLQFDKQFIFINSNASYTTNAMGMAFIINRQIIKCRRNEVTSEVLQAGRALQISIPWKNGTSRLEILGVYAPNSVTENRDFWTHLKTKYTAPRRAPALPIPRPKFVLGDFNLVEDGLDRHTTSTSDDHKPALETLLELKRTLQLVDGWRKENPDLKAYTWSQKLANTEGITANTPRSRIDRIYVQKDLFRSTRDWEIRVDHNINTTDHELITATYFDLESPFIGKGRWEIPSFLLKHDEFMDTANTLCKETLTKAIQSTQDPASEELVQIIFKDMKDRLRNKARDISRASVPKFARQWTNLPRSMTPSSMMTLSQMSERELLNSPS